MSAGIYNERWKIVAPSEKKAKIIMTYIIEHIYDSVLFSSQLDHDTAEKLKKETSKKRVTFRNGGEVEIITLDSRNSKRNIESAMGFGGQNVVLDESSLIDDILYATVLRMLGGHKNGFLLEIGNPFYRNHFYRTWTDPTNAFNKIFIDYHTALSEGRFLPSFIEEMRKQPLFDVFYECKFPDETAIDMNGYRQLITSEDLTFSDAPATPEQLSEPLHLGVDVGGGSDLSVGMIRGTTWSRTAFTLQTEDTMQTVNKVIEVVEQGKFKGKILWRNVHIDDVGIGRSVSDRLKDMGKPIDAVSAGSRAKEPKRFFNRKAEMSWHMRDWCKGGGTVDQWTHPQLLWYKYRVSSDKQIQMEKKEDQTSRTGKSPDFADALMLTFNQGSQAQAFKHKPRGL